MQTIFFFFYFSFKFNSPFNSAMILTDSAGNPVPVPAQAVIVPSGRTVSVLMKTLDVLNHRNGIGVKIDW
jgi:hypothetical protein